MDRRDGSSHTASSHSAITKPSGIGGLLRVVRAARGRARSAAARPSGGAVARRRVAPTQDPAPIEIGLDDPRRRGDVRIAHDGPDQPVDVGRLERRDLAQRVAMELAELEDVGATRPPGVGGFGRLKPRTRSRTSGPFGSDARGVSRPAMSARSGGWPRQRDAVRPVRAGLVPWPGRSRSCRRGPVTGRVGFGARRAAAAGRRLVIERTSRPGAAAPSDVASPDRTSAAYASLISAMRRVATRDAAGSSPVRSGWFSRASRRQAALIVAELAPAWTPRTTCGSRFTIRNLRARRATAIRPPGGERESDA